MPDYWTSRGGTETIIKLRETLELREQDEIKLHVEEDRKKGNHIKIGEARFKHFKKVNISVLSHITFYLADDDLKFVDFKGETILFTCQLIKI